MTGGQVAKNIGVLRLFSLVHGQCISSFGHRVGGVELKLLKNGIMEEMNSCVPCRLKLESLLMQN